LTIDKFSSRSRTIMASWKSVIAAVNSWIWLGIIEQISFAVRNDLRVDNVRASITNEALDASWSKSLISGSISGLASTIDIPSKRIFFIAVRLINNETNWIQPAGRCESNRTATLSILWNKGWLFGGSYKQKTSKVFNSILICSYLLLDVTRCQFCKIE
jgi:hypothetical protein